MKTLRQASQSVLAAGKLKNQLSLSLLASQKMFFEKFKWRNPRLHKAICL